MLDFLKDAKESESTKYQKIHFKTIEYKIEYLLSSLESLTEDEINIIIKENYKIFLTTLKNTENIRRLFTNVKFLTVLSSIIGVLEIGMEERYALNEICYDYINYRDSKPEIIQKLLQITYFINDKTILLLSPYIDIETARILAIARYSNMDDLEKVVRRIINVIVNSSNNYVYSSEKIIDIYLTLFDHQSGPITYTLLYNKTDPKSDIMKVIYNAMMNMLIMMTSVDIHKTMENYLYNREKKQIEYDNIDFKAIPDERLQKVLLDLELSQSKLIFKHP